jgi:hypothetical protein
MEQFWGVKIGEPRLVKGAASSVKAPLNCVEKPFDSKSFLRNYLILEM